MAGKMDFNVMNVMTAEENFGQKEKKFAFDSKKIWHKYSHGKQTLKELGQEYGRSHVWVRSRLDNCQVAMPDDIEPQETILIPDTTFWGRSYGVCVFRSWDLKRNIWWAEVSSEKVVHYYYGRKMLEERGWKFTAAVIDGRRGLATVFKDIPVQVCHFHQLKIVTKYLTRRPKTEAGRELRQLALTLSRTDEQTFSVSLVQWEKKWKDFISERTYIVGTNRFYYTHKNVRSAFLSLKRSLPYLFTFQRHPELHIPNTTNSIDGSFASIKKKVGAHHGLRKDRRFKVISELLKNNGQE